MKVRLKRRVGRVKNSKKFKYKSKGLEFKQKLGIQYYQFWILFIHTN